MQLSEHFSLEELIFSQAALRKGIDNTPTADKIDNLKRLCETVLEPTRTLLGVPLHIDSGYRSVMVNTIVGSTAPHSAHLDGLAADVVPIGMSVKDAFDKIQLSLIPFDQMIIECNAWLHLSIAKLDEMIRRQAMTASGFPGHWVYNYV